MMRIQKQRTESPRHPFFAELLQSCKVKKNNLTSVVNKDLTLKAKAKDLTFKAKDLCRSTDNQQKMHKITLTNDAMAKHKLTVTDRPKAVQ